MGLSRWTSAAVLLQFALHVLAHSDTEGHAMDIDMDMKKPDVAQNNDGQMELEDMPSYAGLSQRQTQIYTHIALMMLAWFFLLPIGESMRRK